MRLSVQGQRHKVCRGLRRDLDKLQLQDNADRTQVTQLVSARGASHPDAQARSPQRLLYRQQSAHGPNSSNCNGLV
jgi:hypothetical protein